MPRCMSTITRFPFIGKRNRDLNPPTSHNPELQLEDLGLSEPLSTPTFIHILDDDSLLSIFYCCRPVLSDEDEEDDHLTFYGGQLDRERWWYKPAQVCRRWRYLILGSISHLGLSLVCTYGMPIAAMLAHSPPLPLIIDLVDEDHYAYAQDEERQILTVMPRHRDRIRRIRLRMLGSNLQSFLLALDGEFPMLESLYIACVTERWRRTVLMLPETLDTPHLCHLVLHITFNTFLRPDDLLRWLSLLPQLETLAITFYTLLAPAPELESDLFHNPVVIHVTLPRLGWLVFQGYGAYLEALLPRITTPVLEKLQIFLSNMQTFSFPLLQQFLNETGDFSSKTSRLMFHEDSVSVTMYPHEGTRTYPSYVQVGDGQFDQQVGFAAQFFGTAFSMVEQLTLEYWKGIKWSIRQNEANRTQWRDLLRTFSQVKTLHVAYHLVGDLTRALRVNEDAGESPMELLPRLKELSYFVGCDTREPFTSFILARRNSGRPVTLVRVKDHNLLCYGHDSEFQCTANAAENDYSTKSAAEHGQDRDE